MRLLFIMLRKELKGYFLNPFGWVVLGLRRGHAGRRPLHRDEGLPRLAAQGQPGLRGLPHAAVLVLVPVHFPADHDAPFAEEERSGTLEGLLTAPVRTWQVVLSKYGAAMTFYTLLWIPASAVPHVRLGHGRAAGLLPPARWLGAYAIILLMGAAFTAIGCLASALTSSQIIAGVADDRPAGDPVFPGLRDHHLGREVPHAAPIFHYISSQEHLHYFAERPARYPAGGLLPERPRRSSSSSPIRSSITAAGAVDS